MKSQRNFAKERLVSGAVVALGGACLASVLTQSQPFDAGTYPQLDTQIRYGWPLWAVTAHQGVRSLLSVDTYFLLLDLVFWGIVATLIYVSLPRRKNSFMELTARAYTKPWARLLMNVGVTALILVMLRMASASLQSTSSEEAGLVIAATLALLPFGIGAWRDLKSRSYLWLSVSLLAMVLILAVTWRTYSLEEALRNFNLNGLKF
jgi:hypothetical protein